MDQYIGKVLDERYEIQELIGTGGMAVVYRALCHRLNRMVAVKILKDEYSQDREFRRRFDMESQAIAMLSHPNIVSVFDVSHTKERDYIVMELIDGISLKQYLEQKGTLNWREALHFATQICKALEHAHSKGIIHRDIKPHNIMLLKDGSVKVADFGIAQVCSSKNTLTREALGSVHYVSPEQAKGGRIDARTDLYSLGVVMYEMLTGKLPFEGDTPVSVAIQHISAKAIMPREINPSIPEGLEQITMRAMEADLGQRYASATELLQALEAFRQNPSIVFAAPTTVSEQTPRKTVPPAVPIRDSSYADTENEEDASIRSKKKKFGIIGIVSICLAAVLLGGLLVLLLGDTFRGGEELTVPNLYMESLTSAQEDNPKLKIEEEREEFNTDVPAGYIISQNPKADRKVKEGATISVVVSLGSQQMNMPNLINYPVQEAQNALDSFGVQIAVNYESSDIYAEGYVISTEPSSGSSITPGQDVTLVVSQGDNAEMVSVPELVGLDVDEALGMIENANLEKGNIKYVDSDLPKGTVTFQSLEQKAMVKEETVINLHVSKGTEIKAQVPNIQIQPAAMTVTVNTNATVSVSASVSDGGVLTYEWFRSDSGLSTDLQPAGTGNVLPLDTSATGSANYCCKITNTLENDSASIFSNMVKITVAKEESPVTKLITVPIPQGDGISIVSVKLDGAIYTPDFEVQKGAGSIEVAVESTGTHLVDVYVDGILSVSRSVEFTKA